MASLAAELQSLADLKAKGVLTEDEFTHAKAAVIAGDADAPIDTFEDAGEDAIPVKSGIGYMTFWSEAFTLHEKYGNIPKDHNLEWRQHLACSKQYDGASLRDGVTSTYETEIIFAALMLGVNWTIYVAYVDDKAYDAVRDLDVASARFWLVVVGWLAIVFSWITIGAVYLLLVMLAPVSDANLPAFVRSSSVTACLMVPNVFLILMFYASSFFFALAVCVESGGAWLMIGLSALMFVFLIMTLQTVMTPFNIAINAGCFSDVPAIAPRDLAKCSAAEVDAALRTKALATVRKHGKPSGLLFSPAPPSALEELYSGASNPSAKSARRRARRVFGLKKRGAVSASIH